METKNRWEEEWRTVAGFRLYQVSNYGRVRSSVQKRKGMEGLRKLNADRKGHVRCVMVRDDGVKVTQYMHRMVAEAFVENGGGLKEVEHVDGHAQNNCVSNLRWVGHREKMRLAVERRGGHWRSGAGNEAVEVPIWRVEVEAGRVKRYGSIREAVEELNLETVAAGGERRGYLGMAGNIVHARGEAKMAYGYVWAGEEVGDVEVYLRELRPEGRSPLAGLLRERERVRNRY